MPMKTTPQRLPNRLLCAWIAGATTPAMAHNAEAHQSVFNMLWHVLTAPDHLPAWALLVAVGYWLLNRRRATQRSKAGRRDSR